MDTMKTLHDIAADLGINKTRLHYHRHEFPKPSERRGKHAYYDEAAQQRIKDYWHQWVRRPVARVTRLDRQDQRLNRIEAMLEQLIDGKEKATL